MPVTIIADQGTHLLISSGSRYAVIERRNGHFYNCHGGSREGVVIDNLGHIDGIIDESDWMDTETARTTFDEIVSRGNQLAQTMR